MFANVIGQAYIDTNLDKALRATRQAEAWLQEQHRLYRETKRMSEAKVASFQHDHGLLAGEDEVPSTLAHLQVLQQRLSQVRAQRVGLEGKQKTLDGFVQGAKWEALANHLAGDDPVLQERLVALNQVRSGLDELRTRYTPAHPKVMEQERVHESAVTRIREGIAVEIAGRRQALELVKQEEASLEQAVAATQAEVEGQSEKLIELQFLKAEAKRNEEFFNSLDHRMTEVGLAQVSVANNVTILDAAVPKDNPVKPRFLLNILAGLVVGLLGGSALVLLLEMFNATIRDGVQVETDLDVPFLGFIPRMEKRQLDLLAKTSGRQTVAFELPHSPVAESLRSLRTRILLDSRGKPIRSLMVSSALPLEGKTFTCTNLASIIAMAGERVLLVDADLRRPSLHKRFGMDNEGGLAHALESGEPAFELARSTNVPNLDVLVAGNATRPAELLQRDRLQALLESLEARYDMVIVDTSPIGIIADGLVWASLTDAAMQVVESDRTQRHVAQLAATQLVQASPRVLGAVLNKRVLSTKSNKYTYYYRPEPVVLERESA